MNTDNQQLTEKSSLVTHQQVSRKEIKYACMQCDFESTRKNSLLIHHQALHMGRKYAVRNVENSLLRSLASPDIISQNIWM